MKIFILAAGPDDGWDAPYPKQLCPIAGEPLLLWTLCGFGKGTIVTDKPEILELFPNSFVPERKETIFDTMLSTRKLWKKKVLILSGDFFYRDDMIEEIKNYKGETPALFGDHSLLFRKKDYDKIEGALERLAAAKEDFFNKLRLIEGFPRVSKVEADLDFDIVPYYEQFLEKNPWAR